MHYNGHIEIVAYVLAAEQQRAKNRAEICAG